MIESTSTINGELKIGAVVINILSTLDFHNLIGLERLTWVLVHQNLPLKNNMLKKSPNSQKSSIVWLKRKSHIE